MACTLTALLGICETIVCGGVVASSGVLLIPSLVKFRLLFICESKWDQTLPVSYEHVASKGRSAQNFFLWCAQKMCQSVPQIMHTTKVGQQSTCLYYESVIRFYIKLLHVLAPKGRNQSRMCKGR
jgi:hypothetical protein